MNPLDALMGSDPSPLDQLSAPLNPWSPGATPFVAVPMDVPQEDHWVWRQIRDRSAKVSNLEEEITMLRYYRTKMQESLSRHSAMAREEFTSRMQDEVFKRINYAGAQGHIPQSVVHNVVSVVSDVIMQAVKRHFPEWDMGPRELKAFQDIIVATGKVAEQYKKIVDGMVININTDDLDEKVTYVMQTIILPAIPREYWPNVEHALMQFAPEFREDITEEI